MADTETFDLGGDNVQYFAEGGEEAEQIEQKISQTDRRQVQRAVQQAEKREEKKDVVYTETEKQTQHQIRLMKLSRFGTSPR